jgi:predicted DsbA family dithiol-disulfide isomerase
VLLSERFKGRDLSSFYEQLRTRGQEAGVIFGDRKLLSNSHRALEASEYARDNGKYDTFHENIFHAYFTDGRDIGNPEVIADVGKTSGLDAGEMRKAVDDHRYLPRLTQARKEGTLIDLTGVPTFIIKSKYKIVGAQPIEVFRELFHKLDTGSIN